MSKLPVIIPDWIKPEKWEEFKEHRKLLGKNKVLNHLSTKKIINKLIKYRE